MRPPRQIVRRVEALEEEHEAHADAILSALTGPERVALAVLSDAERTGEAVTPALAERTYSERAAGYEREGTEAPAPVPFADLPALFVTLAGVALSIGEPDAAAFAERAAREAVAPEASCT